MRDNCNNKTEISPKKKTVFNESSKNKMYVMYEIKNIIEHRKWYYEQLWIGVVKKNVYCTT